MSCLTFFDFHRFKVKSKSYSSFEPALGWNQFVKFVKVYKDPRRSFSFANPAIVTAYHCLPNAFIFFCSLLQILDDLCCYDAFIM